MLSIWPSFACISLPLAGCVASQSLLIGEKKYNTSPVTIWLLYRINR